MIEHIIKYQFDHIFPFILFHPQTLMSVKIRPLLPDVWKMLNVAIYQHILYANARRDSREMAKRCAQVCTHYPLSNQLNTTLSSNKVKRHKVMHLTLFLWLISCVLLGAILQKE